LVLTDVGRLVYRYANEIFSLGSELTELSQFAGFPRAKSCRISEGYSKVFTTAKAGRRLGSECVEGLAMT
jgi:hypothetical protein